MLADLVVDPSKVKDFNGPTIIMLQVGPGRMQFAVHKSLLCKNSPFFTAALQGGWKEEVEDTIHLPHDDPAVVRIYVLWLYRHELALSRTSAIPNGELADLIISACTFGEKVQDADFRDALTDQLIIYEHGLNLGLTSAVVNKAYRETPVGSPLRRLLVDIYIYERCESMIDGDKDPDFLADIARKLLAQKSSRLRLVLKSGNACRYHLHGDDDVCYVVKYDLHHKVREAPVVDEYEGRQSKRLRRGS